MQALSSRSDLNRVRPHSGQPISLRALDTIDPPGPHRKGSGRSLSGWRGFGDGGWPLTRCFVL